MDDIATTAKHERERLRSRKNYLKRKAATDAEKPPDPLLLLTTEERAYLAGLIDGEGSIRIGQVGPRRYTVYPSVFIGMTHKPVMDWLASKFTGVTNQIHNHTQINRSPEKWKPQYSLTLHGKRAQLLCRLIHPYLKVKREQAEIVLEFPCEGRVSPRVTLDQEIKAKRTELFEKMKILNRRGPDRRVAPTD